MNNNEKYNNEEIIIYEPKKRNFGFGKAVALVCTVIISSAGAFGLGYGIGTSKQETIQISSDEVALNSSDTIQLATSKNASSNNTISIINKVSNSVVSINTNALARSRFGNYTVSGAGSGIIIYEDDNKIYIVTNDHVISGANEITISLDDNTQVPATLLGNQSDSDIAVISVNKSDLKAQNITDYSVATFADSSKLEVGEDVIAIGNAAGTGKSATKGIISALNKNIEIDGKSLNVLQTDTAINPGNSGGALVNMDGLVVGVNTAKFNSTDIEGMGYSIPSNETKTIVQQIITNGKNNKTQVVENAEKPSLGIKGVTIGEMDQVMYNLPAGIFVTEIVENSSVYDAGLQAGDVIVSYNEKDIVAFEDLATALENSKVGDTVTLGVFRNAKTPLNIKVTLKSLNSVQ